MTSAPALAFTVTVLLLMLAYSGDKLWVQIQLCRRYKRLEQATRKRVRKDK